MAKVSEEQLNHSFQIAKNELTKLFTATGSRTTTDAQKDPQYQMAVKWMEQLQKIGPIKFWQNSKQKYFEDIIADIAKNNTSTYPVKVVLVIRTYHRVLTSYTTQDFEKIDTLFKILGKSSDSDLDKQIKAAQSGGGSASAIWESDQGEWDKLLEKTMTYVKFREAAT